MDFDYNALGYFSWSKALKKGLEKFMWTNSLINTNCFE